MPLVLFLGLASCNDRFEGDEITSTELAKIDSVNIAQDTMDVYTIQTIKTYSDYAANCEGFYGYDYVHKPSLQRDVATYKFKTTAACGKPWRAPHRSISDLRRLVFTHSASGRVEILQAPIPGWNG